MERFIYFIYSLFRMRLNPFNPQQPARPDFFVGREPEIIQFEKFLHQTIAGSPMNMSITGNRGIGKTSILVKFEEVAKKENCLVVRLSNYEGNIKTIMDFSDFISTNIKLELLTKQPFGKGLQKFSDWLSSLKPQIEWNDVKLSFDKRQIIQECLRARLTELWNEIKKTHKTCVILMDEAESLEKIEGIFQFLREVFQRTSVDCNYMLVLAGKFNFSERMSESFSPLNRFFPVNRLEPFEIDEIKKYVDKKLNSTAITIENDALQIIMHNSEGHPYVLVSMCYVIFDNLSESETKITKECVTHAMPKIYYELEKDFFAPIYHPLTPKAKEILYKITKAIKGTNFTFKEAVKWAELEGNYVSPYIQELLRKGIINKPDRGKYQIFHKLFVDYVNLIHNRL